MEKYEAPKVEIIRFENEDIITCSPGCEDIDAPPTYDTNKTCLIY